MNTKKTSKKEEKFRMNKFDKLTIIDCLALGMQVWENNKNGTLLLFPRTWYDKIPDGFIVTDIFGKREKFKHGKTYDDARFGCLAYGIMKKN